MISATFRRSFTNVQDDVLAELEEICSRQSFIPLTLFYFHNVITSEIPVKPHHLERKPRHLKRKSRHPERKSRHPERKPRHPERSEGSPVMISATFRRSFTNVQDDVLAELEEICSRQSFIPLTWFYFS